MSDGDDSRKILNIMGSTHLSTQVGTKRAYGYPPGSSAPRGPEIRWHQKRWRWGFTTGNVSQILGISPLAIRSKTVLLNI